MTQPGPGICDRHCREKCWDFHMIADRDCKEWTAGATVGLVFALSASSHPVLLWWRFPSFCCVAKSLPFSSYLNVFVSPGCLHQCTHFLNEICDIFFYTAYPSPSSPSNTPSVDHRSGRNPDWPFFYPPLVALS